MEYVIEKHVELPKRTGAACKYPFSQMQIGDSFLIPSSEVVSQQSNMHCLAKRHGIKVATRRSADGLRIFRIA